MHTSLFIFKLDREKKDQDREGHAGTDIYGYLSREGKLLLPYFGKVVDLQRLAKSLDNFILSLQ